MDFEPTLSPRFVAYVRDYLLDRKVDPAPVFEACGMSSNNNEESDTPLPVPQVAMLMEMAARATDNPHMGMSMGLQYHYEASSLLILAVLAAPTVEAGIKILSRYDKYVDTGIETSFDFDRPVAEFGANMIAPEGVKMDQLDEYLMTFTVQTLNIATRKPVPMTEVWLRHSCDQNVRALESFFGAPVKFAKASNKMFFDRAYLREPFLSRNGLLFDVLTNALKTYFSPAAEQSEFIDRVSREIIKCGAEESPSTEKIAQRLAISPRTLRRRLSEEGYSFQGAKNLAREKRARYYLGHTNMPLSEIAFELSYSELSAFSRAFRAWVGETPQAYRERSRALSRA
jgi:AraC-like DNA-binding protein